MMVKYNNDEMAEAAVRNLMFVTIVLDAKDVQVERNYRRPSLYYHAYSVHSALTPASRELVRLHFHRSVKLSRSFRRVFE